MVTFTQAAIDKIKTINGKGETLRIGVQGGGCSGFAYNMRFDTDPKGPMDIELNIDGQRILIDGISGTYLKGTEIDYLETLEASGFKFNNPNIKGTCGCGKSFSA
jgi:iron-sulfur cluster assembly accessory protein